MASGFQQDINQLSPNFYRVAVDMSNTLEASYARARGNLRFRNVVNSLSGLADCQILDITITEANADAQATALTFTVRFERDSFVPLTGSKQGAATTGNNANDLPMDTIAKAVANAVASGIFGTASATSRIYNPDYREGFQLATIAEPKALTAAQVLSTVTVTLIDTVTVRNA
jgi:hypothetical protein